MKRVLLIVVLLLVAVSGQAQTLTGLSISPYGGGMQLGQTLQITPTCTYSSGPSDNCTIAGTVTYTSQSTTRCTVSSSGLVTWIEDPLSDPNPTQFQILCEVIARVGSFKDHAKFLGQSAGWTWQLYIVPWIRQYDDPAGNTPSAVTMVNGASLTVGMGYTSSGTGAGSGSNPIPICNWLSSNNAVATVARTGFVQAVGVGTATISCNPIGSVNLSGSSAETLPVSVVSPTQTLTNWYIDPLGGFPYVGSSTPGGQCDGKHSATYASVVSGGVVTPWRAGVTLSVGAVIADAGYNGGSSPQAGYYETVSTAGTTGTTGEPSFGGVSPSGTITDGTVVWTKGATPYPTNQACALGDWEYLVFDQVNEHHWGWMIGSGDTVNVKFNTAGYNTANINAAAFQPISCEDWGTNGCKFPTIPSGTSANHTIIRGSNFANCHNDANKTLLLAYGNMALNVVDSQFVDISCIEIRSNSSSFTGNNGIVESAATYGVTFNDHLIHGLATGIFGSTGPTGPPGSGIVGVTLNYVNLNANSSNGINMDDAPYGGMGNMATAGGLTMNNSAIGWTGCTEATTGTGIQPIAAGSCTDGSGSNEGHDGLGTGNTTGWWNFNQATFLYNSEDGLDLLHSGLQGLIVTNSLSYGNDGQQIKLGPADTVTIQNTRMVGNCARVLQPISGVNYNNNLIGCRAANIAMTTEEDAFGTYTFQGDDMIAVGGSSLEVVCAPGSEDCSEAGIVMQNSTFLGYTGQATQYGSGTQASFLSIAGSGLPSGVFTAFDHNAFYNITSPTTGPGQVSTDPQFVSEPAPLTEMTTALEAAGYLDNYNFLPATGSPLIAAGVLSETLSPDANGVTRPNPPAIGALEPSGSTTVAAPTASPAAGTYSSSQSVTLSTTTAGASICYTIDGTTPTATSGTCTHGTTYSSAITVSSTTTIMALATLSGDTNSSIASFTFTIVSIPAGPIKFGGGVQLGTVKIGDS